MNPAQRRLLQLAQAAEDEHLGQARAAVLAQYRRLSLKAAEKALKAALSLPKAQRAAALRGVLAHITEAARVTRTPPDDLLRVIRRATADRALNTRDLGLLTNPALVFPDPAEAAAQAVRVQRREMNGYWSHLPREFRDDVARTVREASRKNLDPAEAADLLQERLNVNRSRAVLIAQDQLLTAQARAEQALLKAAGAKAFQWAAMMDSRTRKAHAELNGKVFAWRAAPELPGAAIRCRCRAILPVTP